MANIIMFTHATSPDSIDEMPFINRMQNLGHIVVTAKAINIDSIDFTNYSLIVVGRNSFITEKQVGIDLYSSRWAKLLFTNKPILSFDDKFDELLFGSDKNHSLGNHILNFNIIILNNTHFITQGLQLGTLNVYDTTKTGTRGYTIYSIQPPLFPSAKALAIQTEAYPGIPGYRKNLIVVDQEKYIFFGLSAKYINANGWSIFDRCVQWGIMQS